jgi:hypothetical protein
MQNHKLICVSLLVLLTFSLLIPDLIADACPYCGNDPCTCYGDSSSSEEFPMVYFFEAYIHPEVVERPTTDAMEIVELTGRLSTSDALGNIVGIEGVPVFVEVYGPGGFWKRDFIGYTRSDGSFVYYFEIYKTANLGKYDVMVYAGPGQEKLSFEVVEKTYDVTIQTNLPEHLTADIKLSGSSLSGPFNSGSPKKIELSGEYAYTFTVEEVVEDPKNKSIRYRCKANKFDVSGEDTITFEYEIENGITVMFSPDEMTKYFDMEEFECDDPNHCRIFGVPHDTLNFSCKDFIEVSPGEKKVFRNWQFETYSGDNKTSKFYDDTIINIPYTYPGTIYIYYDTYYNVTVESNKEDLGFGLWAIENSNVSLPQLRIPILFGLGGEWIGEITGNTSPMYNNSIENVTNPEKIYIHYEYDYFKPAIILVVSGLSLFGAWIWYRTRVHKRKVTCAKERGRLAGAQWKLQKAKKELEKANKVVEKARAKYESIYRQYQRFKDIEIERDRHLTVLKRKWHAANKKLREAEEAQKEAQRRVNEANKEVEQARKELEECERKAALGQ